MSSSVFSNPDQVVARIDAIIRELATLRQQLAALQSPSSDQEPLVIEQDGQPQLAILSAEAYQRFRLWERREQARAQIFEIAARRRAQLDWQQAFDLMDELSQRADLSEDELSHLVDRAVRTALLSDATD